MSDKPTYEEYTQEWSLMDKLVFYYEKDLNNSQVDLNEIARHIAHDITRIQKFENDLKQYLIEREYINE
jgi:hypothetical protein